MSLSAVTQQYITQLGLLQYVDPSQGPKGPSGTVAYQLVPTSCWHNGQPFPHDVRVELESGRYDTYRLEGVEYWLVPDETSTNLPGVLAHYAQTTNDDDLQNPPGGGVNRAAETFTEDSSAVTRNPEAVSKYVKLNDNWDKAHEDQVALDARIRRQIGHE